VSDRPGSKTRTKTVVVDGARAYERIDTVATEEPMEIRLVAAGETRTVAVTMRTPGSDFELACGFLFNEGVIRGRGDVHQVAYCVDPTVDEEQRYNIVSVELRPGARPDLRSLERHFFTSSACGVCGKASLEALSLRGYPHLDAGPMIDPEVIFALPDRLRGRQGIFSATGGLHAAALFDLRGELLAAREDVGRHNALDKLIGWALLDGRLPLSEHIVLVSGRASFELVQKSLAAGVPIVCAVSAPSSLAVTVATEFGMTLIGFLRDRRFNAYAGAERVAMVGRPGGGE
jgi:FdhD protein